MKKRAVLCLILLWTLIRQGSAILTIRQGRIVPGGDTITTSIIGIATVELGGDAASQPAYYFDCITNLNNGSGIRWSRMNAQNRFHVVDIPDSSSGMRLDVAGINYPDLDVYTCSDQYSDDIAFVTITASNPAIMAKEETVGVVQGLTVQLEVYISGFPTPTSSHVTWHRPDRTVIMDTDSGITFQDSKRRLILSNVQPHHAGSYECCVEISIDPYLGASTSIQFEVYVPPAFTTQPQEILDAVEWTEVVLNCSASGTPTPMIRWEREGGTQLPIGAVPSYSMSGNIVTSNLTFDKVRYEHRGRYRCVADNIETNPAMSQYTDVRVTSALRLEDERMQPVNDIYFVENEARVRLECFGTGNLQWSSSIGLQVLSDTSGNIYQLYDHTRDALTLVIQNFTNIAIATYTCMTDLTDAHNSPITVSILITSSNPAVIIQSEIQYALPNSSTTLEARVFASPLDQAVVQWYHEGRPIDDTTEASYTASSTGDLHRLTVSGVSGNKVGEYTVVVTLNGLNATDRITLQFPDPPSATITPPSVTVSEGEEVRFMCDAQGSGALTVTWTMSDGSPLPVGVQENGNNIYIASATSSHPGTYVCSVSNLAGTRQDEATLTVYYAPTAVISYNRTMSAPGQQLYLILDHGAPAPTITCSADGYLPPTVEWIRNNGRGLPTGILQQNIPSNRETAVQLRWQRTMEFTDSGSYVCRASNNNGNDNATLDLLVQIQPTISSIYPFNSIIEQDSQQALIFTVPVDYVGRALVCTAKGWPIPVVEWHKNNVPVPSNDGIVSESTNTASAVSATLKWTRGFQESDAGSYQCVAYKQNTDIPLASQSVQLNSRLSTTIPPTSQTCSVQQTSINFQIRVFATNCESWGEAQRAEITSEFRDELLSVIRTECNCTLEDGNLQIPEPSRCSSKVNGAAVFRGRIETNTQRDAERIFCSLLSWQQKSPLIRINDQLRAVDNNCSLEASGLSDNEECVPPTNPTLVLGLIKIVAIAGGGVGFILLVVIFLLICCLGCCYCYRRRRKGKFDTKDDHTYTRTESFSRYSRDGVGVQNRNGRHPGTIRGEEPTYSTLTQGTMDHQSHPSYPESIVLSHVHSTSRENLINSDSVDGVMRVPSRARTQQTEPEAYQIPVSSQENLTSVGRTDNVGRFQAENSKRHVSSTSSYDSTSHLLNRVQNPRPSNSSIEDNTNDYEDISEDDGSVCDSPTPSGKAHGRPSVGSVHTYHQLTETRKHSAAPMHPTFFLGESSPQLRGMGSGPATVNGSFIHTSGSQIMPNSGNRPQRTSETTRITLLQQTHQIGDGTANHSKGSLSSPHTMKQELMAQFPSADYMASCPRAAGHEPPPPYISRPSPEAILHTDSGPDSAMTDNAAYGGINHSHEQHPWYVYNSDVSLNSSTPHSTAPANANTKKIEPYAMIYNEHIPHPSHKTNGTNLNHSSVQFRSDGRQGSECRAQMQVQPYAEPAKLIAATEV